MSWRGITIKTVQRSHMENIVCRRENKVRDKSRIYQIRESLKRGESTDTTHVIEAEDVSEQLD